MNAKLQWRCIAAAALLSFVVGIGFFSPRYVLWRGLQIPQAQIHPEVNRANFRLQQIERPFAPSENLTHWPLRWRILFPLLAHYLQLPPKVFFALPFVGCLLVLGLIAHIVLRETESALLALLSSMLAATTSWFFVSTGWLGYFGADALRAGGDTAGRASAIAVGGGYNGCGAAGEYSVAGSPRGRDVYHRYQ